MTREKAIEFGNMWLQINEHWKGNSTYAFFQIAINTMRKYQEIQEIVTKWQNETDPKIKFARSNMEQIKEVLDNGNDD